MSNTPHIRAAIAKVMLEQVPPLIRNTLLEEPKFREEYGVKTDALLSFEDSDLSIQRTELFNAIREILSGTSELDVTDTEGRIWKMRNEAENQDLPKLIISADERQFTLPNFVVLSPYSAIRLRSLDKAAADVNLPANAHKNWQKILSERPLEDYEINNFHGDFRDTPVHMERSIRSEIHAGQSSVKSLVPSSRRYYDRLVGAYDGSTSIREYATRVCRQVFAQLSAWRPFEGFLFSLLLSSHSALTDEMSVECLRSEDIIRAHYCPK